MSKENSPMYAKGLADGALDTVLIALCPPGTPMGPNPPNPDYPVMYTYGYLDAYDPFKLHKCTDKCRKDGQR